MAVVLKDFESNPTSEPASAPVLLIPESALRSPTLALRTCTAIAVIGAILFAVCNSYFYDWATGDEYWHYRYSERMMQEGIIEREHVHNFVSTTPFILANVWATEAATRLGLISGFDKFVARLPSLGWYFFLLFMCAASSGYLFGSSRHGVHYGATAALWTLLLTSLDQILLGQASIIGADIPFSAMTLVFVVALEAYRRNPRALNAAIVGAALGAAFNVKYSATFLLIFAMVGIPYFFVRSALEKQSLDFRRCSALAGHLLIIASVITLFVDAAYGFKEIWLTFSDKTWYSAPFQKLAALLPNVPLPWPLPFVAGFDHQIAVERTWSWNSVVLGRHFPNGTWFYFPVIWLVKTPLALLVTTAIGAVQGLAYARTLRTDSPFRLVFVLNAFLLLYFCFVFRTQVGIRYVLMCLPLIYLLIGVTLAIGLRRAEQQLLAALCLLGVGYESLPYLGNGLAFTNAIVGDKSRAYSWIADSNIDWFQNYSRARSQASAKLGTYAFNPPHILPGHNVFTINTINGILHGFSQHAWLRENLHPNAQFGFTLVDFNVDVPTFSKFLEQARTWKTPPSASDICPSDRVYSKLANGEFGGFEGTQQQPGLYTGCLRVDSTAVIELKVLEGAGTIGSYPHELQLQGEEVGKGESLWFRLEEGIHPIGGRFNSPTKTRWTIHRGEASLALRTQ